MKALTLWRPWPSVILHAPPSIAKRIENRPWAPPAALVGERFLIHAGRTWDSAGERFIADRWRGFLELPREDRIHAEGIVGIARIMGVVEHRPDDGRAARVRMFAPGCGDRVNQWAECISDGIEPWFFGPFGWILDEVAAFREPVKARGAQGFWTPEPEALEKVRAQIP